MPKVLDLALSAGSESQLRTYQRKAVEIDALSPRYEAMDDCDLRSMTGQLKARLAGGQTLEDILPDAFAAAREASFRVLGKRHYIVQLMGGLVLNDGCVAEMRTGEGKTLVALLAAYLNALEGRGVHVVTVNEYLAGRDAEEVGSVLGYLGLSCGLVKSGMDSAARQKAYRCDVTYGTNAEFGFDYLRDNMVLHRRDRVQRGHRFAIVDEADSVLIDEARTPLIISSAAEDESALYGRFAEAVRGLDEDEDYELDRPQRTVMATDAGLSKIEGRLGTPGLFDAPDPRSTGLLLQALRAEYLFERDKDYAVVAGEVKIIDEFTGRILEGRRYADGLHQALEAKEGVKVHPENRTLASVTLQNYFRLYDKLSGMTGTALAVDSELRATYHMPVQAIPANRPVKRHDCEDVIFASEAAKWQAVADEVERHHAKGQPVLVGTNSVLDSETLSGILDSRHVVHATLNAKNDAAEAAIIAGAGKPGAVTIATNMAGRGTDILLGGNAEAEAETLIFRTGMPREHMPQEFEDRTRRQAAFLCRERGRDVRRAGGLCVIGTSHSESRRVDDQLRGRAGRQGDVGETVFYCSLEDDLMRLHAPKETARWFRSHRRLQCTVGPIESRSAEQLIENAQIQAEQDAKEERMKTLDYDDVLDAQRKAIYARRNEILDGCIMDPLIEASLQHACRKAEAALESSLSEGAAYMQTFLPAYAPDAGKNSQMLVHDFHDALSGILDEGNAAYPEGIFQNLARRAMLGSVDIRWQEHLADLDYLRSGISLRSYAQREPLTEYRHDAAAAFEKMVDLVSEDFIRAMVLLSRNAASILR
jgi:preprotein translocase subunit SecA